ncbi:MAG: VOC family protein [Pseudomonadales bacterium]|mgnify:CR=1 FL=1|nr:VOC family protein [Pseudomonadales bacterium]
MSATLLRRTTFVVPDAEKAADFYKTVFGWKVWYDNLVDADLRFPPSGAPDGATVRLIMLESADPNLGKLGLMSYIEPPFDVGVLQKRTMVRMGEPILVMNTDDIEGIHQRAKQAGATIVTAPIDWTVPGHDGKTVKLRSISMFDPNGIYMEVSQR